MLERRERVNHSLTTPPPSISDLHRTGMALMEQTLEHRIRERAYEIWNANGRSDGQAEQHWLAAERELLAGARARSPAATVDAAGKARSPARLGRRIAKSR
jgi:Protein of unknown function (DUF2934)